MSVRPTGAVAAPVAPVAADRLSAVLAVGLRLNPAACRPATGAAPLPWPLAGQREGEELTAEHNADVKKMVEFATKLTPENFNDYMYVYQNPRKHFGREFFVEGIFVFSREDSYQYAGLVQALNENGMIFRLLEGYARGSSNMFNRIMVDQAKQDPGVIAAMALSKKNPSLVAAKKLLSMIKETIFDDALEHRVGDYTMTPEQASSVDTAATLLEKLVTLWPSVSPVLEDSDGTPLKSGLTVPYLLSEYEGYTSARFNLEKQAFLDDAVRASEIMHSMIPIMSTWGLREFKRESAQGAEALEGYRRAKRARTDAMRAMSHIARIQATLPVFR